MPKYKDGDLIQLFGDIEDHYIKGHVSNAAAQMVMDKEYGDKKVISIKHTFAFWGVGCDETGQPCQIFYDRSNPGRGRFKVTEVKYSVDIYEEAH